VVASAFVREINTPSTPSFQISAITFLQLLSLASFEAITSNGKSARQVSPKLRRLLPGGITHWLRVNSCALPRDLGEAGWLECQLERFRAIIPHFAFLAGTSDLFSALLFAFYC
jgi:hypothetical protein